MSRASTTLSSSPRPIRSMTSPTEDFHCSAVRLPRDQSTRCGAGGTLTGGSRASGGRRSSGSPTTVSHARPPWRPRTARGTMTRDVCREAGWGSKVNDPKATGPVPGSCRGSSTSACEHQSAHQRWARLKRSSPLTSRAAATPQPISPSLPRTHAVPVVSGSRWMRGPGSSMGRVRTRGAAEVASSGVDTR